MTKQNYDNVKIVASGGNLDLALLKLRGESQIKFSLCYIGCFSRS